MWVRKSAIRPVPEYARLSQGAIARVRNQLLEENEKSHDSLDQSFEDFEQTQPALADHVGQVLSQPLSDPMLALGYFLSLTVWLSFKSTMPGSLRTISQDELRATVELFELDEDLRQTEPTETLETDDVIAMEQPDLVRFVHGQIETTLDASGVSVGAEELHVVYRMLLIEVLALSYAVQPPTGYPVSKTEVLA